MGDACSLPPFLPSTRAIMLGFPFHISARSLARSSIGMSLELKCNGDLWIDDHHTAEDCALALGAGELRSEAASSEARCREARRGTAQCQRSQTTDGAVPKISAKRNDADPSALNAN